MQKSFCYKLFINKRKEIKLDKELKIFCNIYNHSLFLVKRYYKLYNKTLNKYALQKHIAKLVRGRKKEAWSGLGYSQGVQDVIDRIYRSYKAFFDWNKKRIGARKSPPKYKAYRKYKSFTLKQASWSLNEEKGEIKIGKNKYRYNLSRKIEGEVKTVTIKRDQLGDYYISLSCKLDENYKPKKIKAMTGKSAGFDFGLNCFLTSSDNDKIKSPEFLKSSLNELKNKSKLLSKKQKGSKNRYKARLSLARLYKKISNQRKDFNFKLVNNLLDNYDNLYFEDLNLNGMKKLWGRKVSDLGLYQLLEIIKFKSQEHNKNVKFIDRYYPSSKTCNKCSFIKEKLSLKDRIFNCSNCNNNVDRDLNAALNILSVGASTARLDRVSQKNISASIA